MKQSLSKDARGLVDGVVEYMRRDGKSKSTLPKVAAFLGKVTESARKEKTAHIRTAVELTAKEEASLISVLSEVLGHEVVLECTVDSTLIAGLRIQVGDWIVDTSLKSQLEEMATQLQQ